MQGRIARWGLALLLALATPLALADAARHWATSWIAPAQPAWPDDFVLPLGMPRQLQDATLRQVVRTSVGGDRLRLVVSNVYGMAPLRVGRVHVRVASSGAGAFASFQGEKDVVVPPGAQAISDPIPLPVDDGTRLAVDLYFPKLTQLAGFHWDARDHAWLLRGNAAGAAWSEDGEKLSTRAFLSAVLVESAREPAAVVALGDSITDGNGATPGADQRWPDRLARRLAPHGIAVLNAGISGNRLARDGMGESALARLQRDVLQHPGVRTVVVLLGTNDIGWPGGPFAPHEMPATLAEITNAFRQLVQQARLHGIRVVAATLPPFEGALEGTPLEGHHSPAKEAMRQALNDWIRRSGAFDAVVDVDRLLRDPSHPARLRAAFDAGDHLHPNDAGYRAMADAIALPDLLGSAFTRTLP